MKQDSHKKPVSRRDFVKATTTVAAASAVATPLGMLNPIFAAGGSDVIRVGLIGCGGRGTGAASNALRSAEGIEVVALADVFSRKVDSSRSRLEKSKEGASVKLTDGSCYHGIDGYKRLIDRKDVDLVIHTTSPAFRGQHLARAVAAGKHNFIEKPGCVDPAGYHTILEAEKEARKKGLAIVTGTMFRRANNYADAIEGIHKGLIGDILFAQARYCSGGIWYRKRQQGMTDVEYQLDNWYHFVWLSGDQIVEQAVHNIDAMNWVMGGPPVRAFGSGGQRNRPDDSEIYDTMAIDFEYANGATVSFMCGQQPGKNQVSNKVVGTKGVAHIPPFGVSKLRNHDGEVLLRSKYKGDAYTIEHTHLMNSIRAGKPIIEATEMLNSSLTAVMGRMAAYTGQEVTWDFITKKSQMNLMPENLSRDTIVGFSEPARPGRTRLV